MKRTVFIAVALIATFTSGVAWGTNPFADVAGNTHEANIDAIYNAGITSGCDATHYCPDAFVTRGQMGTFLARVGGFGRGNFTKTNGRAERSTYCEVARANPGVLPTGPCGGYRETLLASGANGFHGAAVGVDGLLNFVYQSSGGVTFVRCTNPRCTTSTGQLLSVTGTLSSNHPLAIGVDGFPIVAFSSGGSVSVTHCGDIDCASGTVTGFNGGAALDSVAIAIDASGIPVFSFRRIPDNSDLAFGRCSDVTCASFPTLLNLDTSGDTGFGNMIAVGRDGFPVVTYRRAGTPDSLRIIHCGDALCGTINPSVELATTSATTNTLDPTLVVSANGLPLVVYAKENESVAQKNNVIAAACGDAACTTVTNHTLSSFTAAGVAPVAVVGLDGRPVIASYNRSGVDPTTVELARCSDTVCTTAPTVLSLPALSDGILSMTIGFDGVPLVIQRANGALYLVRAPA